MKEANQSSSLVFENRDQAIEVIRQSRVAIDSFDEKIAELLSERLKAVCIIGAAKKAFDLPVLDKVREVSHMKMLAEVATRKNVPIKFMVTTFMAIMAISRATQHQQTGRQRKTFGGNLLCGLCRIRTAGNFIAEYDSFCCPLCRLPTLS